MLLHKQQLKKLDAEAQAGTDSSRGRCTGCRDGKAGPGPGRAVRQLGLAEAEALEKKAEALAKMNDAGKLQMVIDKLPEIARAIAEPMAKIGNITIIDGSGEKGDASGAARHSSIHRRRSQGGK